MIIYNRNGDELIDVPITSSAVRKRVLMGDNYVSLPFSHDTYIDFAPGSYIIYNGLKFEIIDVDKNRPTRNATTGGWDYTLQFDDQERHMTRAIVFWLSQKPREAVFHDTTDLQSFGNLIVENMNAFVPAKNWKMRDLSDELKEGTKLVSFNGDTCWNAVNTIAETFGVEWWTEQSEGYIYLCFGKLEIGTEEDFVEGDVITSIPSRRGDDSNYGTRFYVFGSTRNLTEDYGQADQGGTTNHVSEIRLRLPGGQEYIDARPDMAWNDVVEKFVVFEDIYPKNTDTVTSVEKVKRQTDSGTEYEARVIYAKDTPFLPTDLIPGETLQAVITSGALSGRTFDIQLGAAFDDPDTWNPETNPFDRKFEIVADVETTGEQEIIIPNDNLDIEPGNTFVLTGIKLPGARIGEAEQELLEAGTTWAQKNSKDTSVYDCPTNPVYCQLNDKSYELGQKVRLVNEAQFGSSGRSSRIQGYEKSLDNEYQATYTVGDNTAYSRLGEIEKDIQEAAYAERIGVTNGVGIYLIRAKYDQTQPTDYNAYSAAAADEKFLSRKKNDTAEGIITFAKGILANTLSSEKFVSGNEGKGHSTWIDDDGVSHTEVDQVKARKTVVSKQIEAEEGNVTELTSTNIEATVLTVLDKIIAKDQTLSGKISSAKFLSGLLGYGWMIDTQGNGELHSLSIRSFLEVPELRYNQVQVVGDELWVTAGGVISDVQAADSGRYTITLKLEEGQINPFAADDILRGIYHVSTGFSTIQMRVDSVAEDGTMTVTPRTPDLVPQKFMNIAKTGNFTNTARQRSILISSKQGRIQFMADVNDWEIAPSMVRMILGDTSGFVHPSFGDTSGYNAFLENILMTGRIFQKSADGTTTKPVAVNKGEWETGTYYYYDEVTHKGSLWLCTAESTSEEPSASSIDWVEEVASGAGSAGPAGPALRSRGVWSASETYINGGEFRDWVLYGEHNYRYVVKEGVATVPAGTLPTDTAYWTPFNEMEPVATRVLLADDAWIDILSTNGIRIGDNGWELTDGEIRHKTSGLKLTKDGKLVAPNGLSLVVGEENIDDYTQQKIDSVEIGSVNLIDNSKKVTASNSVTLLPINATLKKGDTFALSIQNVEILSGTPNVFSAMIWDAAGIQHFSQEIQMTSDNLNGVFTILSDYTGQDIRLYLYAGKRGQTTGNSVVYHEVMLVKGNRPALTWSPSLNDQKAQTQEQIDSIQVGTVNLLDDTKNMTGTTTDWYRTFWDYIPVPGRQYTARLLNTGNTPIRVFIGEKKSDGGYLGDYGGNIAASGEVSVYTFTTKSDAGHILVGLTNKDMAQSVSLGDYDISDIMLVEGNKAPATWSPSLNDQKDQTQEMVDASLPATRNLALKTEGQLDFDTSSWAGLYLDLAEQPVIGQQYVLSWDDIQFTETSHPVIRLWINSFTGAVNLKEVTQTGSGSVVVTIPDTLLTNQTYRILFGGHNGAMTGYVKNPMWSKGNKVMPWTPAIEDAPNEIREEAKATGIYLSEKKIDVVADRFRITSTTGREIMRADADGNRVSMENLDVQAGATIGPVEVTETGLAVKAEGEDLQTVISNQEFGSLSDALGTGKTSIVALTAPSVSQPGGQFDMGTFSAPDATVRILSVSGRVIMMNGLNSVRIYLTKQVGSQWTDLGIELFSMASNSHYDENFTKSVVISSIGNYKIACTAVCGGVITISNMSGTLQEQVKRMEVRPSTIFGMLNSTQYFLLGREKPSASGSEIFRAKIQNEDGGLEVTSTGVNIDGETYIDGQTTINGNASVVGKFSATGEINATGNIQSDTDIEAVRDILIGRYLKGLAIPSEKIPSSLTSGSNYQIADSATCIDAMNTNAISITLPKNPKTGQIILIRQYSAGYTLKGGGKQIHRAGSTVSEFWNDAYGSLMWIRFDGSYWALNYMPSL